MGICQATWTAAAAAKHGRVPEKTRFFGNLENSAAGDKRMDEMSSAANSDAIWERIGKEVAFPELGSRDMQQAKWQVLVASAWRRRGQHINELEAKARCATVRRLCRDTRSHGKRVLVVGDNMSVVCSGCKRRSNCYYILRECRKAAAASLACGVIVADRWTSTHFNAVKDGW